MTANHDFVRIAARIDALAGEMVEFQKALTALPALSPQNGGEGEWDKALFIEDYLRKCGLGNIERVDIADREAKHGVRPNLIVRIPGKSVAGVVWIMAHLDVVPPGDLGLWSNDPWEAVVKDGFIYGRGTEDNQQGIAGAVFAARAFIEENLQPERTLAILLCADEETGSALGLEAVLNKHPDYFNSEDLIIAPDIGAPDSTMIEVAEKSILWLKFTTSGEQCHASKPDNGINACEAAAELIVRLKEIRGRFNTKNSLFIPPESTFVPTKREANVPNVNTMPGEDIFYLDCRILPEIAVDEVLAAIREICGRVEKDTGVKIACETEMRADSAPPTSSDAPVVRALQKSVREVYGKEARPMGFGGGTVAAIFRRAGLPAAVWATINQTAHQPDENCLIANLVGDAKVFAHICLQQG